MNSINMAVAVHGYELEGIVGRDTRSPLHRAARGAVHERVVRLASCAVLVTPAPSSAPPRVRHLRSIGPATSAEGHA